MEVQIWQHLKSGETYAVILDDGMVVEAEGPLDWREIALVLDGGFDSDVDVAEAINDDQDSYRLVEADEIAREIAE